MSLLGPTGSLKGRASGGGGGMTSARGPALDQTRKPGTFSIDYDDIGLSDDDSPKWQGGGAVE